MLYTRRRLILKFRNREGQFLIQHLLPHPCSSRCTLRSGAGGPGGRRPGPGGGVLESVCGPAVCQEALQGDGEETGRHLR